MPEYGDLGDIPIAGDWDGDSDDNIGVYRPGTGEFFMDATLPEVLSSKTVYVDDDFSDEPSEHKWDTIQEGVDDAADGDTVIVYAGEYVENVDVDKSITLRGDGADVVTVRAASAEDHVFEVTADWVNISGFTVTGATGGYKAGIQLGGADHCSISDNNASGNSIGIYLYGSSSNNNTLTGNNASGNGYRGIYLLYSSNNTLTGNTASGNSIGIYLYDSSSNNITNNNVSNNHYGVYLWYSSNNTLANNTMSGNTYNFYMSSFSLSGYTQNIDTSNKVDGKPIYYWVDQKDRQIPSDAGFVGVVNGTNITVRDLTLTNNSHGVLFAYTENSMIENVTASNNDKGICLDSSSNNTLTGNNASNNKYGIGINEYSIGSDFVHSSGNTLRENTMSGNVYNFGVNANGYSIITRLLVDTRLLAYIQNIDTSNIVDGKPIYYWVGEHDKTIPRDAGFVGVVNCTNITVRDLTLTNNRHGILFAYTNNSRIVNVSASNNAEGICLDSSSSNTLTGNNTISNSGNGIYLCGSSNNTLTGNNASSNRCGIYLLYSINNTLRGNTASGNRDGIYLLYSSNNTLIGNTESGNHDGIYLRDSSNNTLMGNTASNSCYGIWLSSSRNNTLTGNNASNNDYGIGTWYYSDDNTLYHNNLINNTLYNAYDTSTNTWDSGSEGNYYSDYTGTDPDGDGIGEDPHPIPGGGGSIDRFPLMQPWTGATSPKGDLNHDGILTPADAAIALRLAAGGSAPCDPAMLDAADVSRDGRVTSLDALMILQAATDR